MISNNIDLNYRSIGEKSVRNFLVWILTLGVLLSTTSPCRAQGKPVAEVKSAKGPYFATFNSEHTKLLATCFAESEVQVVDLKINRPVGRFYAGYEPVGIAASPSGDKILVTNLSPGLVKVISTKDYEVLDDIKVGGRPSNIVISSNGLHAYVANFGTGRIGKVDFINVTTHRIEGEIEVGVRPSTLLMSQFEDQLFVVCSGSNDVYQIDIPRKTVIDKVPVGLGPDGIAMSADGSKLYVANSGTDDISVIDILEMEEIRRVPVGSKPFNIRVTDNNQIWVVETGDKRISVYDSDFNRLRSYEAKKKPVDIQISENFGHFYVTDEKDNRILIYQFP